MGFVTIFPLFAAGLVLTCGTYVFFQSKNREFAVSFFGYCFFESAIMFTEYSYRTAVSITRASFWLELSCLQSLSYSLLLQWLLAYIKEPYRRIRKYVLPLIYLPTVVLIVLQYLNDNPLRKAVLTIWGWSYYSEKGALLFSTITITTILALSALTISIFHMVRASDKHRSVQRSYVLLGIIFFSITSVFDNLIAPGLETGFPRFWTYGVLAEIGYISYGIWRHQLFELGPQIAADSIIETMSDGLLIVDEENKIVSVNSSLMGALKAQEDELLELHISKVLVEYQRIMDRIMRASPEIRCPIADLDTSLIRRDKQEQMVSLSVSILRDRTHKIIGSVYVARDNTERRKSKERLSYIAFHDPLTDLLNRKAFYDIFDKILHDFLRDRKKLGALLFLDLDFFKEINDTYGHDTGDVLLKEVADRLNKSIRKSDFAFRIGGDEFTILLMNLSNEADAALVAKNIIDTISAPMKVGKTNVEFSTSIGIAMIPRDGTEIDLLIKRADTALYESKKERRTFKVYSKSIQNTAVKRLDVLARFKKALEENLLELSYQPIVNTNQTVCGAEVLARWFSKEKGLLMPTDFIPVIEDTGLINHFGEWVIHTVCRQRALWSSIPIPQSFFLSINISPKQLRDSNFAQLIESTLEETSINPTMLQLEITESALLADFNTSRKMIENMVNLGVPTAIDNFGTGFSSFSNLSELPLKSIKIDRSFIGNIPENNKQMHIVEAVLSMTKGLNMQAFACGIERKNQFSILKSLNCKFFQGYYVGEPMNEKVFSQLLRENWTSQLEE